MRVVGAGEVASIFALTFTDANQVRVERQLILSGKVVPSGTKTYVTGLRGAKDGQDFCGGSLISLSHALTASHCIAGDPRWVPVGSHYRSGARDGEQIRIVSIMSHPRYWEKNIPFSHDFMVLELEKPSSFPPVKLAAHDDSDFKAGKMATTMGWGYDAEVNGTLEDELQRVDVKLASDQDCKRYAKVDSSMVCAGGVLNQDTCGGDSGGPLMLETSTGKNSTEDVLIGVISWAKDETCGREATMVCTLEFPAYARGSIPLLVARQRVLPRRESR